MTRVISAECPMLQAPRGHASRVIIRPKVIVPDQIERTLAPVSACAPFCLRLGNFLHLHGREVPFSL